MLVSNWAWTVLVFLVFVDHHKPNVGAQLGELSY
jgi:hypothetical protein